MGKKWILLFFITTSAWGYQLTQDFKNGFYWASLPVRFIVVEKDPNRKAILDELSSAAINQWENQTGLSLWDLSSTGTSNIIRWSTNFAAETRMDPQSVLAVAIRYTNGPYFAKSEIVINGSHNAFNTPYENINKMNIGTTLVHELGHTIGLDHSENMLAVMAPSLQYPYNGLHSDDLNGMSDAHAQTEYRQLTRYVSPLAYTKLENSNQPLSCGTTATSSSQLNLQGLFSLGLGLLIGLIRKVMKWFKSLL
jgi:Matrixin